MSKTEVCFVGNSYQNAPERLLQNVYESFATLMHCRLCTYSILIARHGVSVAEKEDKDIPNVADRIEEKLERLHVGQVKW